MNKEQIEKWKALAKEAIDAEKAGFGTFTSWHSRFHMALDPAAILELIADLEIAKTAIEAHQNAAKHRQDEIARLAEHSLSAQDEVLTDEWISAIYEQSQGMTLRDRDFQGVAAFARALVKAFPAPANPHTEIREAILQYYDDLSARKHGGMAQDKAFQTIQDTPRSDRFRSQSSAHC